MLLRWIGSALHEAQQRFRRLKGFQEMKHLVAALDRRIDREGVEEKKRVASNRDPGAAFDSSRINSERDNPGGYVTRGSRSLKVFGNRLSLWLYALDFRVRVLRRA